MVFQDPLPNGIWHSPPLITQLLVEQIVPLFGMPEALLPDRGTNLLSVLMQDVCKLLGIKKLNTTVHHPQCDGMDNIVEASCKVWNRVEHLFTRSFVGIS